MRRSPTKIIQTANIRSTFNYKEGELIRINPCASWANRGRRPVSKQRYRNISFEGVLLLEHRLIYLYHNPDMDQSLQIDHINGDKHDNRIENLRAVTNQGNHFNETRALGASYIARLEMWRAYIVLNNKQINLGVYDNILDARAAYLRAKRKYHVIEER